MAYPPQPWSLRGRMYVSVFALPVRDLPPRPSAVDEAVRVLRIGRYALVGAAWVDYQPGGDMAYHELLAAVLMRAGPRPRVTITHIWVDSADSRDGGRELWGIPKELADIAFTARADATAAQAAASQATASQATASRATDPGAAAYHTAASAATAWTGTHSHRAAQTEPRAELPDAVASADLRRLPAFPIRLPIRLRVTQDLNGRALTTPVRATASCGPARLSWRFDPGGPLGFLAGRRPLLSVCAADFRMRFGQAATSASTAGA